MVEKNISDYARFLRDYTELRLQENRSAKIVLLDGSLTANETTTDGGVCARVYKNGCWGFSSSPGQAAENVESVIKAAAENASFLDCRLKKGKGRLPCAAGSSENDFSTKKPRKTRKELVDFLSEIDSHIARSYKNLKSRRVIANSLDMEKSLLTSDGARSYSMTPRSVVVISLSAEKDGAPVELYELFGARGQFEDVFENPADLFPKIASLYGHLMKKTEGVFPDAGSKECVLDSELSGILAHEAIGHTTEADFVLGGSVAAELMNQEVAAPLVTLVDFANSALGETCPVPVYVDDEGTKAEDAVIIDRGVLKTFMHNKETAEFFGSRPTGNARAHQFSDEPLIRMRNTAILPGKDKLEDMIASVKDGYYLMKCSNGQADSTSEFMFGVPLGYEIKNGKLGRALKDTTISGVAFDVLKSVSMISGGMTWLCGGWCGKKQIIPVGMGGPAIKCRVNIGGK